MAKEAKLFILDTNVILHDYKCIEHFQENDVIIPIVVLEELDKFKKGNEQINFNAREFVRYLDKLSGDSLFNGGVSLGKGRGKLRIELGHPFTNEMLASLYEDTPDHRILAVACHLAKENTSRQVVLISKDVNLRMKAKSLQVQAQDYLNDKVQNIEELKHTIETIEKVDDQLISSAYNGDGIIPFKSLKIKSKPYKHQNFILKGDTLSMLSRYDSETDSLYRIEKQKIYNIEPRNSEQAFAVDMLMNPNIQLVALTGIAGTGKTLLALAAALAQEQGFDQIILARPVIPLQNQEIGFLPGDIKEKIGPYMLPLFDNLSVIKSKLKSTGREYMRIEEMLRTEKLNISPLAYIRGRSLSNAFFIIDEAQNLTPHEIKTIITRAGENTKMVFTGDIYQIDSPYLDLKSNGLTYLCDKMLGQELFGHVNLVKGERSPLAEIAGNIL